MKKQRYQQLKIDTHTQKQPQKPVSPTTSTKVPTKSTKNQQLRQQLN